MFVSDFLFMFFEDTLEDARLKHLSSPDVPSFNGVSDALADCRAVMKGRNLHHDMTVLLRSAMSRHEDAFLSDNPYDAAYSMNYAASVEWVASVISAVLMQQQLPLIVVPNLEAMLTAIRIISI